MKKYFFYILFFSITVLLFYSCKTTNIYIESLRPPEINLSIKTDTFYVINRSLINEKQHKKISLLLTNYKKNKIASEKCIESFTDVVNYSGLKKAFILKSDSIYGTGKTLWPLPLEKNEITTILKNNNLNNTSNLLVSLEIFNLNTYTENNNEEHIDYTVINVGWRIYDIKTAETIDKFDEVYYFEENKLYSQNKTRAINSKYLAAAQICGALYAVRISPNWSKDKRIIYSNSNKEMKKAAIFAKNNNWEDAFNIWNKLLDTNNYKLKSKILFNLALYFEINNNLDKALEYIRNSYKINPNKYSYDYLNSLEERKLEIDKIEKL